MIMINLYSGAFQISLINLVINGLANSGDAYAQNYLLIPRLPILMALSSSSTTTSWAASPPPSIFLFNIMTPSVLCLGMAVAVQFFLRSSSSSCPDNLNQRNHLYHHRPYICHHIGRAKVLTPLVMIAKSFIDSQVRGVHSVSPRRLSE